MVVVAIRRIGPTSTCRIRLFSFGRTCPFPYLAHPSDFPLVSPILSLPLVPPPL